jgi:hypothetical protein
LNVYTFKASSAAHTTLCKMPMLARFPCEVSFEALSACCLSADNPELAHLA